jgi:hypothetical protein
VTIGVDLGQRVDPTAIVVAEKWGTIPREWYLVTGLRRLPIGTKYPMVADELAHLVGEMRRRDREKYGRYPGPPETHPRTIRVVADATGAGIPACELIRERLKGTGARLTEVTLTGADGLTKRKFERYSCGKEYLVSRLQALLQTGRVRLPAGEESETLVEELLNYEIRITEDSRRFTAGAFKTGTHDDLATALGLAVLIPIHRGGTSRFIL